MTEQNNNYRNREQDRRLVTLEEHISVINRELGGIKATQAVLIAIDLLILGGLIKLLFS